MTRVGGSVRRVLAGEHLAAAAGWGVAEIVVDSWDPEASEDRETLAAAASRTAIVLHCLSLSPLGDAPRPGSVERARAWCDALGIDGVTDHFAWVGAGESWPGVFLPPIPAQGDLCARIERLRDRLGRELGLENVFVGARDPAVARHYHESFADVVRRTGAGLLLDLENIRLDAVVAGIAPRDLLTLYEGLHPLAYHVAGSRTRAAGGFALDTHDGAVPDLTLALAREALSFSAAPVIYELDVGIVSGAVEVEVDRLRTLLEAP